MNQDYRSKSARTRVTTPLVQLDISMSISSINLISNTLLLVQNKKPQGFTRSDKWSTRALESLAARYD